MRVAPPQLFKMQARVGDRQFNFYTGVYISQVLTVSHMLTWIVAALKQKKGSFAFKLIWCLYSVTNWTACGPYWDKRHECSSRLRVRDITSIKIKPWCKSFRLNEASCLISASYFVPCWMAEWNQSRRGLTANFGLSGYKTPSIYFCNVEGRAEAWEKSWRSWKEKGGTESEGGAKKKLLEAFGGDRQLTLGGRVTVRERSDFLLVL